MHVSNTCLLHVTIHTALKAKTNNLNYQQNRCNVQTKKKKCLKYNRADNAIRLTICTYYGKNKTYCLYFRNEAKAAHKCIFDIVQSCVAIENEIGGTVLSPIRLNQECAENADIGRFPLDFFSV